MKFTELQKYKHDTVARFETLKSLTETITEENLLDEDSIEILMAADEVYESMAKSSKKLLESLQKQRI